MLIGNAVCESTLLAHHCALVLMFVLDNFHTGCYYSMFIQEKVPI